MARSIKNKNHRKEIKKECKKPLPLQLMIDGKWKQESESYIHVTAKRLGLDTTADGKNIIFS